MAEGFRTSYALAQLIFYIHELIKNQGRINWNMDEFQLSYSN